MFKKTIIFIAVLFLPFVVLAQGTGLVPCTGLDCSLCHVFSLFERIFTFAVTILAPAVAVFGIAYGGYFIMFGGANSANVSKGKAALKNTVIGFVIVYASYAIASTLVWFLAQGVVGGSSLNFGFQGGTFTFECSASAPAVDLSQFEEGFTLSEPPPVVRRVQTDGAFKVAETDEGVADVTSLNSDVQSALGEANAVASSQPGGFGLVVTSGYRNVTDQQALVQQFINSGKCPVNPTRSGQCDPEICIPNMTLAPEGSNCRHTTGNAVDVFGTLDGNQCGRFTGCQNIAIGIMQSKGFCVLKSEQWHFELKSTLDAARRTKFNCPES